MNQPVIGHLLHAREVLSSTPKEWVEVVRGTLSPDEAVRRLEGRESPELLGRSKQMFAPPSDEQRRAWFAELIAHRARLEEQVQEYRSSPRSSWWWLAPVLSLAVAAALLLVLRPSPTDSRVFATSYKLEFEQEVREMRSSGASAVGKSIPTYRLSREMLIRLVPERTIQASLDYVAFAQSTEGEVRLLTFRPSISSHGVIELSGVVRDVGLDLGEWELTVAIGYPGYLPVTWDQINEASEHGAYELVHASLRVVTKSDEIER